MIIKKSNDFLILRYNFCIARFKVSYARFQKLIESVYSFKKEITVIIKKVKTKAIMM